MTLLHQGNKAWYNLGIRIVIIVIRVAAVIIVIIVVRVIMIAITIEITVTTTASLRIFDVPGGTSVFALGQWFSG